VSETDIARAVENAKSKALPEGRIYLHHIKNGFLLDGKGVETPLHHQGQKLEVAYWHLHADTRRVTEAISVVNRYGLPVDEILFSGVASAQVSTTEEDRKKGCLALDIGAGATHYAIYRSGSLIRAGVISIGGDHLTNDLACGLRVNANQAEALKKTHGKALADEGDKAETRWLYGDLIAGNSAIGNRPIKLSAFAQILQPRLEELFDIVREELGELYDPSQLKGGIILTGGTSRLQGIVELAKRRLSLEAKLMSPLPWVSDLALKGPEYSTVLGLLYSALTLPSRAQPPAKHTFMEKISKLFNQT
jgi:cell division protein FtsA